MKGRPFFRLAILASLLLCAGIAVPVAATDVTYTGQKILISGPGLYVLKNDIVNSAQTECIEIAASDVVFDGGGHLVDGMGTDNTIGIYVGTTPGARNVTVRNVRVRDWGYGVYLDGAVNSRIESSALQDNLFCGAMLYRNAAGNTVAGCNVTGNAFGIILSDGAADCTVSENRVEGNEFGLYLYGSDRVTVTRNVIAASTETGLQYTLCGGGTVYDNLFDNTVNVVFTGEPVGANAWSVAPRDRPERRGRPLDWRQLLGTARRHGLLGGHRRRRQRRLRRRPPRDRPAERRRAPARPVGRLRPGDDPDARAARDSPPDDPDPHDARRGDGPRRRRGADGHGRRREVRRCQRQRPGRFRRRRPLLQPDGLDCGERTGPALRLQPQRPDRLRRCRRPLQRFMTRPTG